MSEQHFERFRRSYLSKYPDEKADITQEHLVRLSLGRVTWNRWCNEFRRYIDANQIYDAIIDLSECEILHETFWGYQFTCDTDFSETTFTSAAIFDDARFTGNTFFRMVNFMDITSFSKARFTGEADFSKTRFTENTGFQEAIFTDDATFIKARFSNATYFNQTTFTGNAGFSQATFTDSAGFSQVTFTGDAFFNQATFTGDLLFYKAMFIGDAFFNEATFTGAAAFSQATFTGVARFNQTTFTGDTFFNATYCMQISFVQAQLHRIEVNSQTQLGIADFSHSTVDRFSLDKIEDDSDTHISAYQKATMTVVDDGASLRLAFGGLWRVIHILSLIIFLTPYLFFLFKCWSISYGLDLFDDPKWLTDYNITIGDKLWEYIYTAGQLDGQFIWWRTLPAIFIILFNFLRYILLFKTIKLEHQHQITGYPIYFYFSMPVAWKIKWKHLYLTHKIGFLAYFLIVLINALIFLNRPILFG